MTGKDRPAATPPLLLEIVVNHMDESLLFPKVVIFLQSFQKIFFFKFLYLLFNLLIIVKTEYIQ